MSDLRLAFLNASHQDEYTRRNFRRELPVELVEYDVTGGELPESCAFDGCVVSGSRASVYWDEAWLPPLKAYVHQVIEAELPVLGVCFGHQLLADVLGGTVEDMGEYEIGYREIERTADAPLFADMSERFTAFTTHSDTVTELPAGAELLAENEYGIHGFRVDDVYGVQFHPEYDIETAEAITRAKDELAERRKQRVLAGITEEAYAEAQTATRVFENFVERVVATRTQDASIRPLSPA